MHYTSCAHADIGLASMGGSSHHTEKPMDLSKAFNSKIFKIKSLIHNFI